MFDYTSCSSGNAIYIIKFLLCDSYYIGQSTNCKHRLATHIRGSKLNITTFSSCTTVVNHFNSPNHLFENHFTFYIFRHNIIDKFDRLNLETQLIHLFLDLGCNLINVQIPDRYYWYHNTSLFRTSQVLR